jgi:hypothetical protein
MEITNIWLVLHIAFIITLFYPFNGYLNGFLAYILGKNVFFSVFYAIIFDEYYFEIFLRGSGDDIILNVNIILMSTYFEV